MSEAKLIALEGIDGSGKSTQCALLRIQLESADHPVIVTKAKPKNLDRVFKAFLRGFEISSDSIAYMFLYQCLHRLQHDKSVQAISEGTVVVADRWNLSYFVYHNLFGDLSKKSKRLREQLDKLAFCGVEPDIGFLIDLPVEVAIGRRIARGDRVSNLEKEKVFYDKVREEYKHLAGEKGWVVLDGTPSIEDIHKRIVDEVLSWAG